MKNRILTEKQILFLNNLPETILDTFYLTGGTALSAFYLEHRLSQDLDLFTDAEETMPPLEFLIKPVNKLPDIKDVQYERLFDRRIFAVTFQDDDILKVEFTTYPFRSIEKRTKRGKLSVDSLLNLITGKIFAMIDRYDPKDFVDLYFVMQKYDWTLSDLITKAEKRFAVKGIKFIIPERLLFVNRIGPEDLPVMLQDINLEKMKSYFINQSSRLIKTHIK